MLITKIVFSWKWKNMIHETHKKRDMTKQNKSQVDCGSMHNTWMLFQVSNSLITVNNECRWAKYLCKIFWFRFHFHFLMANKYVLSCFFSWTLYIQVRRNKQIMDHGLGRGVEYNLEFLLSSLSLLKDQNQYHLAA